jgi:hypothetical protein
MTLSDPDEPLFGRLARFVVSLTERLVREGVGSVRGAAFEGTYGPSVNTAKRTSN